LAIVGIKTNTSKVRSIISAAGGIGLCLAAAAGVVTAAGPADAADARAADVTSSYVAADAETGAVLAAQGPHDRYRSASLVKLYIAIDYFETLGPDKEIPADDRALLEPMLRSSNDDAASTFWVRDGGSAIVDRMVAKIGLTDTTPPPAGQSGVWGYTGLSATDVAKTYQYISHSAAPRTKAFILDNLRRSTPCGSDGFDQSFGIPSAVADHGAVKQGWSGFGAAPQPGHECPESGDPARTAAMPATPTVAKARQIASAAPLDGAVPPDTDLDLVRPAMHTSGTVDADGKVIVVLTLEPTGTTWETSASRITALAGDVDALGD
jgi:hypothetical protein